MKHMTNSQQRPVSVGKDYHTALISENHLQSHTEMLTSTRNILTPPESLGVHAWSPVLGDGPVSQVRTSSDHLAVFPGLVVICVLKYWIIGAESKIRSYCIIDCGLLSLGIGFQLYLVSGTRTSIIYLIFFAPQNNPF